MKAPTVSFVYYPLSPRSRLRHIFMVKNNSCVYALPPRTAGGQRPRALRPTTEPDCGTSLRWTINRMTWMEVVGWHLEERALREGDLWCVDVRCSLLILHETCHIRLYWIRGRWSFQALVIVKWQSKVWRSLTFTVPNFSNAKQHKPEEFFFKI